VRAAETENQRGNDATVNTSHNDYEHSCSASYVSSVSRLRLAGIVPLRVLLERNSDLHMQQRRGASVNTASEPTPSAHHDCHAHCSVVSSLNVSGIVPSNVLPRSARKLQTRSSNGQATHCNGPQQQASKQAGKQAHVRQ
jgi:hypothetical protein